MLFGGTIPLESPDAGKVMNTMLVYEPRRHAIGLYHKMHLFGFSGLGERYAEADTISAGGDVPKLTADGVPLAAGVCYDLRFPEFSAPSSRLNVLLLPAAFTYNDRQSALGIVAARPRGGKSMLRHRFGARRRTRKRQANVRS